MFRPYFKITPKIAKSLMQIEAVNRAITDLPLTLTARTKLRETAKLLSTHYSTVIDEGLISQTVNAVEDDGQ